MSPGLHTGDSLGAVPLCSQGFEISVVCRCGRGGGGRGSEQEYRRED